MSQKRAKPMGGQWIGLWMVCTALWWTCFPQFVLLSIFVCLFVFFFNNRWKLTLSVEFLIFFHRNFLHVVQRSHELYLVCSYVLWLLSKGIHSKICWNKMFRNYISCNLLLTGKQNRDPAPFSVFIILFNSLQFRILQDPDIWSYVSRELASRKPFRLRFWSREKFEAA